MQTAFQNAGSMQAKCKIQAERKLNARLPGDSVGRRGERAERGALGHDLNHSRDTKRTNVNQSN
eukprot:10473622-Lingulodinium_polyedra.AAC.1